MDIAVSKHEYWSSLAPIPLEVVNSAGEKAREESWDGADFFLCNYRFSYIYFKNCFIAARYFSLILKPTRFYFF